MITTFLQIVAAVSAMMCLSYGFSAIVRMNRVTNHGVRVAFISLAVGAFGELIAIIGYGHIPTFSETALVAGIGLLSLFGRREHYRKCPYAPASRPEPNYGRRWQDFLFHPNHPTTDKEK